MKCEFVDICQNRDKCYRCYNMSLYKETKSHFGFKKPSFKKKRSYKDLNKKDSWKVLEEDVSATLNDKLKDSMTRRSRMSGALPFEKGDVVDNLLNIECKERGAEKSFSIKKEWLQKASKEAEETGRRMCLPFRFKGDEDIYCVMKFEDIAEIVSELRSYMIKEE